MRKPLYFIAIAAALTAGPALAQTTGTDANATQERDRQTETDRTGTGTAPATTETIREPGQDSMGQTTGERTNPASVEPAAGQDMQGDRKRTDKDKKRTGPVTTSEFVTKAAMSGRFEVESSELVAEKTENSEVSAFARQMINDHSKANDRLKELAGSAGQAQAVESDLDDKHQKKVEKLREAGGADLDRQYIEMQVAAHEKAVELFRNYAQNGDDVGLKGFAKDTLPTLERHLDHAQRLSKAVR